MTHPVNAYNHAEYVRSLEARLAETKQLLDTAHALICQAVASRNNGGMTTTPTHDEMRAWLLAYADRATDSADEVLHQCSCGHAWMAPQLPDKPCPVCNTETDNG